MHRLFFLFSLLFYFFPATAQPKYEVRAAWLTTLHGLDWPHTRATTPYTVRRQQEELIDILDRLQAAHFNTVLFQVRTRGEVLYPSSLEPFATILTGKAGAHPSYDPLAFVIEECHKRGMECHAWMVTLPLGSKKQVTSLGSRSVVTHKKHLCALYKNEYFLQPGNPETKEYLLQLVKEIVGRYDIDGMHFDYLRYPENAPHFPDRTDFRKYANGHTLEEWRRENISQIMRCLYKGVKEMKPWVKVSASPVGKYRDTSRYSSHGWNAFFTVCQDPQAWLAEGIIDQIYPMMYFRGNHFYPFALDWQEQSHGRHVVPGLGIYFLHPDEGKWTCDEIIRQVHFLRQHKMAGEGCYRVQYLMENTQGIYDELAVRFYQYPALQPSMPWLDTLPPTAPAALKITSIDHGYTELNWQAATDNDTQNRPTYVVYASDQYPVDVNKAENIVAQGIRETHYTYAPIYPWEGGKRYFAVTAVDRYGNESEPATFL